MRGMDFDFDCIVVGAGPAGLSAALTLGRARRNVLVLDSDRPRNFAARAMHGVLGHDGLDPRALRATGAEELARYGIEVRAADVQHATAIDGGVELDGVRARTLILATGLIDATPDVPGFDAIYGISAHTCPYCDGWEHQDERIAVLAPAEAAEHLGPLLRQWSDDVVVVTEPIARFAHEDGRLTAIEFESGERLERDALFFHVGFTPRTELAAALGCELDERGFVIAGTDHVYAAGNCADPMQTVVMAIADGARAGVAVNVKLVGDGVYTRPAPAAARG